MSAPPIFGRDVDCGLCDAVHVIGPCPTILTTNARLWKARADMWWSGQRHGFDFTAEDLCRAIGRPDDEKVIGSLFARWHRIGRIERLHSEAARRPMRHGGDLKRWRVI